MSNPGNAVAPMICDVAPLALGGDMASANCANCANSRKLDDTGIGAGPSRSSGNLR